MNQKQKHIIKIEGLGEEFSKALLKHKECKIVGVGVFHTQKIKARIGTHPQTSKPLKIEAHTRVKYAVCKTIKDKVNKR